MGNFGRYVMLCIVNLIFGVNSNIGHAFTRAELSIVCFTLGKMMFAFN